MTTRRRTLEPLPPELLQFDGRQYTTTAEWRDAFEAFHEERERSKQPGYVCSYDDYDSDYDAGLTQVVGELNGGRSATPSYRPHAAHGPRGNHARTHENSGTAAARTDNRSEGFGAGIM